MEDHHPGDDCPREPSSSPGPTSPPVGSLAHILQPASPPPVQQAAQSGNTDLQAGADSQQSHHRQPAEIVATYFSPRSDAGYATDDPTSATTSLSDAAEQGHTWENGRRYHTYHEGRYPFPNDEREQEREELKHHMTNILLNDHLHFAPLGTHPQAVLDIGTGRGSWAIEMGDRYPSANILGIDLSHIQHVLVPPNVSFLIDDVEDTWLYPRDHFDYIHARHTVMAIRNWPRLLRRSLVHLRPGGWIELQEMDYFPQSAANYDIGNEHPVAQYWDLISAGLSALGIDFRAAAPHRRLEDTMRDCGFTNIQRRTFQVPIGSWPRTKLSRAVGLHWRTILLDGIQAIAMGPLTRGCGWSREEVEVFLIRVRRAYNDDSLMLYMSMHVIYAQKPRVPIAPMASFEDD